MAKDLQENNVEIDLTVYRIDVAYIVRGICIYWITVYSF
jgi:hypothetical protein